MRYISITDLGQSELQEDLASEVRLWLVSLMAAAVGILAGIIDFSAVKLIYLLTNACFLHRLSFSQAEPWQGSLGIWMIAVPVAGGLIVGVIEKFGTPKVRGGGIAATQETILLDRSVMEPRIAIYKPLAATVAIGTGGPFGKEGLTIQTTASLGSLFSRWLGITPAERRIVVACCGAAGMGASFHAPISGVLLAVETLLFEVKSRSLLPLTIAATLAAAADSRLLGAGAPVRVGVIWNYGIPGALPWYALLGVLCGLAAVGITKGLYASRALFRRFPAGAVWVPAVGAVGLGVIGYFVPRVLGLGYGTVTDIFRGALSVKLIILIMVFKALALIVSWGSGSSGGLLSPMLMSGVAMGSLLGIGINALFPQMNLAPGAFALAAMGAIFGAASRAPATFIVLPFEFVRDANALLPLMIVNVLATGVALLFLRYPLQARRLENHRTDSRP